MPNQFTPAHAARQTAIANGDKTYCGDAACKHCGSFTKYTSSMGCVGCNVKRNRPKLDDARLMAPYRTKEKVLLRQGHWRTSNPQQFANQWLRAACKRAGITPDEYFSMLADQRGVCLICHRPCKKGRLSIDHNHQTNRVRGLLCRKCNLGIGDFEENIKFLRAAIRYLGVVCR